MIPSEAEEQATVIQYCEVKNIPYFHVPNSTHTTSYRQRAFNHAQGLRPGVPDLFILLPKGMIAIEMKRIKGSTTSKHQKDWIDKLNKHNVPARVCKGAVEAINFIKEMEKKQCQVQ